MKNCGLRVPVNINGGFASITGGGSGVGLAVAEMFGSVGGSLLIAELSPIRREVIF